MTSQGPYVVARTGFEPTTFRKKGNESTNEPPCPTLCRVNRTAFDMMIITAQRITKNYYWFVIGLMCDNLVSGRSEQISSPIIMQVRRHTRQYCCYTMRNTQN